MNRGNPMSQNIRSIFFDNDKSLQITVISFKKTNFCLYFFIHIQGVSQFDRQTFRADSMIKNKHKTLNTYEVKNA
jgi:hypothetical protein